ncbi:MAG: DUF1002 domain-containing protein [Lachnospiraceae bacterium]|nr:DUF1002 domain-containing protein [Lachnospiraceae bacterium]
MKKLTKIVALCLCMMMLFSQVVMADSANEYISLGADLTAKEKATVLDLLDIDNIDDYQVSYVTNEQEHKYLDEYLSSRVIGTRALSSVRVQEGGDGIEVTTHNITYCTAGMYRNALATAGMENAIVTVAGPFNISGTAALVGAMKAYSEMTGKDISQDNLDAANEELVVTGTVAEDIGDEDAEKLMALIKQKVVEEDISSSEDIKRIIEESAKELNVRLSDKDRELIEKLMKKIDSLDLDVNQLKKQAKDIYKKLESMGLTVGKGLWERIRAWLLQLLS